MDNAPLKDEAPKLAIGGTGGGNAANSFGSAHVI